MRTVKLPGLEGHDWIDSVAAAEIIGCKPETVPTYVFRGQLRRQKFGSSNVYDLKDVQRFAEKKRGKGRPPKSGRSKG